METRIDSPLIFSKSFFLNYVFRGFCYRARALARQTEREIETESEKSPPRGDGHAAIPVFSTSSFIVCGLRIRYLIHLELIFVNGDR